MINKLLKRNTETVIGDLDRLSMVRDGIIPSHIAIIMDGNGRWAKKTFTSACSRASRGNEDCSENHSIG